MSPYGDFLGIQIDELSAGRAVCSMTLMDHHLNNGSRVHGGVLTSCGYCRRRSGPNTAS